MTGTIYWIGAQAGPVKIGFTKNVKRRLAQLQTAHAVRLGVLGTIPGTMADEADIHRALAHVAMAGEWFARGEALQEFAKRRGVGPAPVPLFSSSAAAEVVRKPCYRPVQRPPPPLDAASRSDVHAVLGEWTEAGLLSDAIDAVLARVDGYTPQPGKPRWTDDQRAYARRLAVALSRSPMLRAVAVADWTLRPRC